MPFGTEEIVSATIPALPAGARVLAEGGEKMLSNLMSLVQSLMARMSVRDESGQALVEYGLLVGLIAAVCVVVITTLGGDISSFFSKIAAAL